MKMLNGYYIGNTESKCKYCNGSKQEECVNDCSSTINTLSDISLSLIEEAQWNTAGIRSIQISEIVTAYITERSEQNAKMCSLGDYCNDGVLRTTNWKGKIGLIYPSDYGYASVNEDCSRDILGNDSGCNEKNWLHPSSGYYWTISAYARSTYANVVWCISSSDRVYDYGASNARGVRPTLNLKSNVTFVGEGNGTEESPYILGINE